MLREWVVKIISHCYLQYMYEFRRNGYFVICFSKFKLMNLIFKFSSSQVTVIFHKYQGKRSHTSHKNTSASFLRCFSWSKKVRIDDVFSKWPLYWIWYQLLDFSLLNWHHWFRIHWPILDRVLTHNCNVWNSSLRLINSDKNASSVTCCREMPISFSIGPKLMCLWGSKVTLTDFFL